MDARKKIIDLVKYGWVLVLVLFVAYTVILLLLTWPITKWHQNSFSVLGSVGDSFGALTALFTGLAFWLALHLFKQQKEEFSRLIDQSVYTARVQRAQLQPHLSFEITNVSSRLVLTVSNDGNGFLRDPEIKVNDQSFKPDESRLRANKKKMHFLLEGNSEISWEGPFIDGDMWESRVYFFYTDITDYDVGAILYLTKIVQTDEVALSVGKIVFYDANITRSDGENLFFR
ncbi:hypothetical protein [Arenicella xantha]|uniref:Uncharacterized protein n=1 Tax=Arenicella xantha TaxID=644221 RepID=A0A395JG33_9GAMM|nr:hypothetical protein [Arenicella xantha]RBP48405.1 hypothetical protein DFR28_1077 [Arenicella xantha]